VFSVRTQADKEEVAQLLSHYDFTAMPVVDGDNRLVGIVTFDDALEVLEEEATEDMEKMAGMSPSEHTYLLTTVWDIWKQRIPWLILMMLTATFTGLIISHFEEGLAKSVALVGFIPMLMGTAGNGGSQSSVTIIRSLSLGDLEFSDLPRVLWKESRVSLLCGVALGAASFVKLLAVDRMLFQNPSITIGVAAVVALTLTASVFFAKLVGCALPLAAKALHLDPAVMASPFISTIVDALSLLVYFGFASLLLFH
jgi:magnesium transporter